MMTPLEQISADIGWRESELASLRLVLLRDDLTTTQHVVLLRASWAMLYAHYEGFIKTALTIFYDEITKRMCSCDNLPKETRATALNVVINTIKHLPAVEFLDKIEEFHSKYYLSSPTFPEVDTKSNLWPAVFKDLLKTADLDHDIVEKHKREISTLVSRRNDIAHGKNNMIKDISYYSVYENSVYNIMYEIIKLIDQRLKEPPYSTSAD